MKDAELFCLLPLAIALFVLILLYTRYRNSPAARWKSRVRSALHELAARLYRARRELAAATRNADDQALKKEFLIRQLEGVAVEELARYPNIGPVTVSKLRSAGLTTVAACRRARLDTISGIGPARGTDLIAAIVQVGREAQSRFDAGASPEGAAYKAELKKRQTEGNQQRQAAEAELRANTAILAALHDRVEIASRVSFFGYLRRRQPPGLTVEMMNRPLIPPPAAPALLVARPVPPAPVTQQRPNVARGPAVTIAASSAPAPAPPKPVEVTPLERMRAVIALGLAMAKADGRIAAAERKQVRAFVERRYTTVGDLTGKLDTIIAEIESDVPALGDALWQVKRVIPANAWPELYQFAVSVADSAGERNTREVECLARVAEELGISIKPAPLRVPAPVVVTTPDAPLTEPECRSALEIAPETPLSVDLVRRQHRLLSDRFDPEKFTSHGADFVKMAAEKRERAEKAARHLLAGYNEPLEPPATPPPPTDLRHNPDLDDVFGA